MISTSDLRKGITIELDGRLLTILDYQHIKMGRGSAQVRLKFRDVRTGAIFEQTFQAGTRFNRARVERRPMQYLYNDGEFYHFMNTETYEQVAVPAEKVSDAARFLRESDVVDVVLYGDEVIGIELPPTVELTVTETEPGFKGDTATGATKPATLETGLVVQVPLFINPGDRIKVNTETGEYVERVS